MSTPADSQHANYVNDPTLFIISLYFQAARYSSSLAAHSLLAIFKGPSEYTKATYNSSHTCTNVPAGPSPLLSQLTGTDLLLPIRLASSSAISYSNSAWAFCQPERQCTEERAGLMIDAPHAPAHKKATPTCPNALASADKDGELRPRQLSASDLS
jgi:hypothetical protein